MKSFTIECSMTLVNKDGKEKKENYKDTIGQDMFRYHPSMVIYMLGSLGRIIKQHEEEGFFLKGYIFNPEPSELGATRSNIDRAIKLSIDCN